MNKALVLVFLLAFFKTATAQKSLGNSTNQQVLTAITGAERIEKYLPLIKGRRVALFANQTSTVGTTHLVDTLQKLGIDIKVIFGPEHGFRGNADAGEKVGNYVDKKTGIPVVSLYGTKRRPDETDLAEVDIMLFDIQDVGVRFYTFISSLEAYLESAIEFNKPLIILDRPNPNGFYVDGPVLDTAYRSFIGMQPIPIVYGLTLGEYATMLVGEGWTKNKPKSLSVVTQLCNDDETNYRRIQQRGFSLIVICCDQYTHRTLYEVPVKPSPNLPGMPSIYLYPSTCFFEGTALSEGRGTNRPFVVFGHPSLPNDMVSFTPQPNEGAKNSKHYGKQCYGWDLGGSPEEILKKTEGKIQLKWLLEAYRLFPEKDSFFLLPKSGNMKGSFFNKLAGNNELWQQIRNGVSEEAIKKTWEPGLLRYKSIRKKYLLYEDFE